MKMMSFLFRFLILAGNVHTYIHAYCACVRACMRAYSSNSCATASEKMDIASRVLVEFT